MLHALAAISAGEKAEVIQLAFVPSPLEAAHCLSRSALLIDRNVAKGTTPPFVPSPLEAAHCLSRSALLIDCNVAKGITPPFEGQLYQHNVLVFLATEHTTWLVLHQGTNDVAL